MANYRLFDNLIQAQYTQSYAIAAKELLLALDIQAPILAHTKADVGSEGKALNSQTYHYHNAYNLALASKENSTIICPEDCSFASFIDTKKALADDTELQSAISGLLKKDNLELALETPVLSIGSLLESVVGLEYLKKKAQKSYSNFYVALSYGNKGIDSTTNAAVLTALGAKLVTLDRKFESDGYEIFGVSKEIAFTIAGFNMLDMFDHAADFVVANDARSFFMYDHNQKHLESSVGRDINLTVLSLAQVTLLALGVQDVKKAGLDLHKIKTTLI